MLIEAEIESELGLEPDQENFLISLAKDWGSNLDS